MNREVVFEYLDNGERKSIHFVLDEDGMLILHNILLKHGRYVNKGNRTIFFHENAEAKEVAKLVEGELILILFTEYQTCHIFLDIISLSDVWLLRIDN